MEKSLYEISFVGNENLHQFRTRMDKATSEKLYTAIDKGRDYQVISDVQVYPISEEPDESAAIELVDILDDANYDEDEKDNLASLRILAEKVDLAAEKPGAEKETYLVEYVWDNGGGDDNAFSQGVCVNKKARKANKAFFDALEIYLDDKTYDLSYTPASNLKDLEMSFTDALEATREVLEELGHPLKRLDVILQAAQLEQDTPAVTRKRRGPRL